MEFESEKKDYNVAEFYDNFGHQLPKIVMVNQGFMGEIAEDTFDREQVLRLHTVSRQRRVVARSEHGNKVQLYSIPLGYKATLSVVTKRGKAGKEQSLMQILKEHSLPVTVKFPKDHTINIGGSVVGTNHFPPMDLIQDFDEMYLLGNFIIEGVIAHEVVHVPLYLWQMRLSLVTGIKGHTKAKWKSYNEEVTRSCNNITYDLGFGNKDIAVYNEKAFHSDTMYSFVQPAKYTGLMHVFPVSPDDMYDELVHVAPQQKHSPNPGRGEISHEPHRKTVFGFRKSPLMTDKPTGTKSRPFVPTQADAALGAPPIVAPKSRRLPPPEPIDDLAGNSKQQLPGNTGLAPALPARQTNTMAFKQKFEAPYENNVPRGTAARITHVEEQMEYITEDKDYNVVEFCEQFEQSLPKVAMISQGFCGEIVEDTFDRGQILRFTAVSRQERVVARSVVGKQTRLYSIPLSYQTRMCLINKNGKVDVAKPLYEIIHENQLPISVHLPKDRTISIGNQQLSTNHIPIMELMNTFDEMYLLGNFIHDGEMVEDVTPVPLYLSQLRFSVVTGIKNRKWEIYLEKFKQTSACCEYDMEFGNPEIAVYKPESIRKDTEYTYVEPTVYSNFITLFKSNAADNPSYMTSSTTDTKDITGTDKSNSYVDKTDANVYEEIGKPRPNVSSTSTTKASAFSDELSSALNKQKNISQISPVPQPKPKQYKAPSSLEVGSYNIHKPAVPGRNVKQPFAKAATNQNVTKFPKEQVKPLAEKHQRHDQSLEGKPEKRISSANQPIQQNLPILRNGEDVTKLTINEVGEFLKLLNLGQYVDQFREQLVDGSTLKEYDKEVLKEEFGFKGTESIRLVKFAKDGHVPK